MKLILLTFKNDILHIFSLMYIKENKSPKEKLEIWISGGSVPHSFFT